MSTVAMEVKVSPAPQSSTNNVSQSAQQVWGQDPQGTLSWFQAHTYVPEGELRPDMVSRSLWRADRASQWTVMFFRSYYWWNIGMSNYRLARVLQYLLHIVAMIFIPWTWWYFKFPLGLLLCTFCAYLCVLAKLFTANRTIFTPGSRALLPMFLPLKLSEEQKYSYIEQLVLVPMYFWSFPVYIAFFSRLEVSGHLCFWHMIIQDVAPWSAGVVTAYLTFSFTNLEYAFEKFMLSETEQTEKALSQAIDLSAGKLPAAADKYTLTIADVEALSRNYSVIREVVEAFSRDWTYYYFGAEFFLVLCAGVGVFAIIDIVVLQDGPIDWWAVYVASLYSISRIYFIGQLALHGARLTKACKDVEHRVHRLVECVLSSQVNVETTDVKYLLQALDRHISDANLAFRGFGITIDYSTLAKVTYIIASVAVSAASYLLQNNTYSTRTFS